MKKCYEFLYCSINCVTSNHNCQEQLSDCEKLKSMSSIQKSIGLRGGKEFAFVNTTFQCLSSCIKLRDYLINIFDNPKNEKDNKYLHDKLLFELSCVMIILCKSDKETNRYNSSKLKGFLNKAGFIAGRSDMHEFLLYLLNHIHNILIPISQKKSEIERVRIQDNLDEQLDNIIRGHVMWSKLQSKNTIITQLFYGQFKYTLTCKKCNYNKILYEYFLTLSIPVVILYIEFISTDFTKYYFNIPFKEMKIFTLRKIIAELLGVDKFSFIIYRKINKESITIENDNSFIFTQKSNEFICFQFDNSNNSFKPNDKCYIKYIKKESALSSPFQENNIDINEIDTVNKYDNNNLIPCKLYCMDTFIDFIILEFLI